jgi:hypothetical protein
MTFLEQWIRNSKLSLKNAIRVDLQAEEQTLPTLCRTSMRRPGWLGLAGGRRVKEVLRQEREELLDKVYRHGLQGALYRLDGSFHADIQRIYGLSI